MMESKKIEEFTNYLDQRTSSIQENALRLMADNRRDEADFEKIRANIFQIVKQVAKAIFKNSAQASQEESQRVSCLESRLILFQETWESFLKKAEEHGDDLKIVKEETKLEALAEIREAFQKIWGCQS